MRALCILSAQLGLPPPSTSLGVGAVDACAAAAPPPGDAAAWQAATDEVRSLVAQPSQEAVQAAGQARAWNESGKCL